MDRQNELHIRSLVARAQRHGWEYAGAVIAGYLLHRKVGNQGVTLIADRTKGTLSVRDRYTR